MRLIRTLRQILDVVLVLLVVLVLGTVLAANVAPGLGHQLLVIRGGSMEPAIGLGAVVDVVKVPVDQLRKGDVITVKGENGVVITHRIFDIKPAADGSETWFRTKGDANETPDPVLLPARQIEGRVALSVPFLGYLMYMLTIPTGILSIFLLAGTLLLSIWLLEDLEEAAEDDEEAVDETGSGDLAPGPAVATAARAGSAEAGE